MLKVKIGDKIYDAEIEPIMIILDDECKNLILNMNKDCTKICFAPEYMKKEAISNFMKVEE